MSFFLLLACRQIEPAPSDIDGLAHHFWKHFDDEEGSPLAEGIGNLHNALDGEEMEEITEGLISALDQQELDLVGKGDEDASSLTGVYYAGVIDCTLESIEPIIYDLDQASLREGTYVSYEREYTTDFQAYAAREEEILGWETVYEVEGFGADHVAFLNGWLRYGTGGDLGPFLLSRVVLNEPAPFSGSEERGMYQDYQLETFHSRKDGKTVHFYVIWREMVYAGDIDFASESVQRLVLDGLADWDRGMEENCRE